MSREFTTFAARALAATLLATLFVGRAMAQTTPAESSGPAASETSVVAESGVSASGDLTTASRYLFQGFDYSDGTANIWGNYHADHGEFDEVDISLKVERSLGSISAAAGYMNLQYPNRTGWDPSQEVFVDLGLDAGLSPKLSVHYDFDVGKGTYTTLGVSHSVGHSISLATNLFYQGRYYGMTGFPAAELKASWEHSTGAYTFTPAISYFATWENGDFKDVGAVPSAWLFALNVARAF
jgi:hypothetical protein